MTISATKDLSLAQRLDYYSEPRESGCREWTSATDEDGYGLLWWNGRKHGAHRLAWENHHKKSAAGRLICHTCDNPGCINPLHLFDGTPKQNSADMVAKQRQARGERHGGARLSENDVRNIRTDQRSQRAIAAAFDVAQTTIGLVKHRKSWKHVEGEVFLPDRITEETVRAILLSPLGKTLASRKFGVARSWVQSIRKGEAWSHVKVDPALIPDRGKGGGWRGRSRADRFLEASP